MMSNCTNCRKPTDLALSDVLTNDDVKSVGGASNVPLIGTCGEDECVRKQMDDLRAKALTGNQRARAAIVIAEMAASLITAATDDEQHGVAYLMQEFALMLLREGNGELTPSDSPLRAEHEADGKLRIVIVAPGSAETLTMSDEEADSVTKERKLSYAKWLKAAAEIDLECIA